MDRNKKHIFGILLPQDLWAFLAMTARYHPNKAMHWTESATFHDSHAFLRELDKKICTAADRLRSNIAAAVHNHTVLGLMVLIYVSDSFAQRQAEIEAQLRDPESNFHLMPADYRSSAKYDEARALRTTQRVNLLSGNFPVDFRNLEYA